MNLLSEFTSLSIVNGTHVYNNDYFARPVLLDGTRRKPPGQYGDLLIAALYVVFVFESNRSFEIDLDRYTCICMVFALRVICLLHIGPTPSPLLRTAKMVHCLWWTLCNWCRSWCTSSQDNRQRTLNYLGKPTKWVMIAIL